MGRRIRALRPEDLFQAEVELVNLELASDGDTLVRQDGTALAQVVLHLPYQHLREPASDVRIPTRAAAAGPSKLAFEIPPGTDRLSLAGSLLKALESVPPAPWHSMIELPGRVLNWVYPNGPWRLGARPATSADRTALWRADLRGTVLNAAGWREGPDPGWQPVPSAAQLAPLRHGYVRTDGLTLSPLGATTRLSGPISYDMVYEGEIPSNWPDYLDTYDHTVNLGRDTRVRVATPGYLSTGHRAVAVTTRTRVLVWAGSDIRRARLLDTACLMVSQSEVDFDALASAYRHAGREMPLRRLRILLAATPPLSETCVQALQQGQPFWVATPSGDLAFPMAGTDWTGAEARFAMPLVFVPDSVAGDFARVAALYRADPVRREPPLAGQRVSLARPSDAGSTAVPVDRLTFDVEPPVAEVAGYGPAFLLTVPRMRVHLDALAHFTNDHEPVWTELHERYLTGGHNPAGAFLDLAAPASVRFAGAGGGGLARPNTEVAALTALDGLVPRGFDVPDAIPDVTGLFGGAKILGFLPLADLLTATGLKAPGMTVRHDDHGTTVTYRWQTSLTGGSGGLTVNVGGPSTLDLEVTADRPADGAPPASLVRGRLTNVAFGLAGVATVRFADLSFASVPGRAPEVDCSGCELVFAGALEFLNSLRDLLPSSFGGVMIEVTEAGILARYAVTVPSAGVGVAALSNLSLRTELRIPFTDEPTTLRFALSERHHPFTVTVGLFGGGGFFALEADTDGVRALEAAIEFGGGFSLDIGVATGGVYLMAGVYLALSEGQCRLSGYVRCGGYVSVLGIVSISVEFYLGLEFRKDAVAGTTEVWGRASVTVGIQVLLFSTSVTLPFERRFAGAPGDPPFIECVTPSDWDTYCQAFA